ncbi:hypothetical protein GCM10010156_48200 [Planobispora rosea]|uniref:Uncharacterized protein n=1 Tax=Planobispora rosea TaxID=35762 RepID=A0A8J3S7D2_PLARO|nr:hypothetical protein GCM10010156_48200 [Planobispora rosea]GIH86289.1 hypothetical protein Pro02_46970 [Planobispora rosea]
MTWWTIITDPVGRALTSGMTGSFRGGKRGVGVAPQAASVSARGRSAAVNASGPVSSAAGRKA